MNPLSLVLLFGFTYGVWVMIALLRPSPNQSANRILAALVFLVNLKLIPYILGFSGVYQKAPWLSFAPFELDTGFGPLLYFYVLALTQYQFNKRSKWHLLPPIIQFLYDTTIFVQPLSAKNVWYGRIHVHIEPYIYALGVLSLAVYLVLSLQRTRQYRAATSNNLTQGDPTTIRFLWSTLRVVGVYVVLRTVFGIVSALNPRTTLDNFYLGYFWLSVLIYVLGTGALALNESVPAAIPEKEPEQEPEQEKQTTPRDWKKVADQIEIKTTEGQLWLDPNLSLPLFADKVELSPGYISKALNLGLNESFSDFINRHRVQQLNELFKDQNEHRDVLELAFECGFNSKASFNRIYKNLTGETPSQARTRLRSASSPNP